MPKILVTGCNGQLGQEIKSISDKYNYKFYFTDRNSLDITNFKLLEEFISINKISTIINCAAYTAVDAAKQNRDIANLINHKAPQQMAQISKKYNIHLIHISTDYVFDGKHYKPYIEEDETNPINIYGQSKRNGELAILQAKLKNSIIIRTSWLHSSFGENFVKKIVKLAATKSLLKVVYDQIGTPTSASDLAKVILDAVPQINFDNTNIYHYSNEGVASWYDLAKEAIDTIGLKCEIVPVESSEFATIEKRPYYCVLNKTKIKHDFKLNIPHWRDSISNTLKNIEPF